MTVLSQSSAPLALDAVLDPRWLSAVLSAPERPLTIDSVEVVEVIKTVATKVRFAVDWHDAAGPRRRNLCVKGYFDGPSRRGAGLTETLFYRELANGLSVRLPPCVYTGIDPETEHAIVIMDDLVAAGDVFLTALSPYSSTQASASLDQLARLHAATWGQPELDSTAWLEPNIAPLLAHVSVDQLQDFLDGERGDGLPRAIRDARRLRGSLHAVMARGTEDPACLVHGDAHAGNVFESSEGPGLIDWQLVQRGSWALDVAYHIAAVLDVDDRERDERALLAHYLDRLRAYGVAAPQPEAAWLSYRAHLAYGYFLWGITRNVDNDIILEFVRRLGSAVAFHDSFALLGV